tara:strand:- start:982 stop:1170 length:189 start_codon:yes stop_codon:yes gene_type:complete
MIGIKITIKYLEEYIDSFKRGLADALLVGTKSDNQPIGYKQGYDYGIYLWCELNPDKEMNHE